MNKTEIPRAESSGPMPNKNRYSFETSRPLKKIRQGRGPAPLALYNNPGRELCSNGTSTCSTGSFDNSMLFAPDRGRGCTPHPAPYRALASSARSSAHRLQRGGTSNLRSPEAALKDPPPPLLPQFRRAWPNSVAIGQKVWSSGPAAIGFNSRQAESISERTPPHWSAKHNSKAPRIVVRKIFEHCPSRRVGRILLIGRRTVAEFVVTTRNNKIFGSQRGEDGWPTRLLGQTGKVPRLDWMSASPQIATKSRTLFDYTRDTDHHRHGTTNARAEIVIRCRLKPS